jgi:hypothetical protein
MSVVVSRSFGSAHRSLEDEERHAVPKPVNQNQPMARNIAEERKPINLFVCEGSTSRRRKPPQGWGEKTLRALLVDLTLFPAGYILAMLPCSPVTGKWDNNSEYITAD